MGTFTDRVAIVTGAGSGIGRATARKFAAEGAKAVICIDIQADRLAALNKENAALIPAVCDVTDHAGLEKVVADTLKNFGRIDVLVNNAGYSYYERLVESSLEHWRRTQAINIESMFVLAKLVAPAMIEKRYGRIVNVGSVQALASEVTVGAYAASKGAIHSWTRSLAVDLSEYGILVNAIAPGAISTDMSVINGVNELHTPMFKEWYEKQRKIPLARPGQPEEIANAIYFLSGDQCTYICGATLVVDGGLTITF